jgi:hypothetical protein
MTMSDYQSQKVGLFERFKKQLHSSCEHHLRGGRLPYPRGDQSLA